MLDGDVQLNPPAGLKGFGNILLWLVAVRAPDLVDGVYLAGRARRLTKYKVGDYYLPSPMLIGWLLAAAELKIAPDRPPYPGEGSARKVHTKKTLVSQAFNGDPKQFNPEWFETLARQCGFTTADLALLKQSQEQVLDDNGEIICVDLPALRAAIETTRRLMPAPARPPPGPGPARLVAGEIPREPEGFVKRALLDELADAARLGRPAVLHAMTGLRGVGKTQIAAAYARRRIADNWSLVAWVSAETRDTLIAGLSEVARQLGLAAPDDPGDSLKAARLLRDHLNGRTADGLVIFDNATSPEDLRPFLPAAGPTQVVVTTTEKSFRSLGTLMQVPYFDREQSLTFLAEYTGLPVTPAADDLAAELGDLPLALAQAAATISQRQYLGYAGYLELLHAFPVNELLADVEGSGYQRPVAAALLLSVATAENGNPDSLPGQVLRAIACLSPDGVPHGLLVTLGSSRWELDEAIARCTGSSLLSRSRSGNEIIMHRLLGRVLRERELSAGRWPQAITAVLDLLEPACFPDAEAWTRRLEGSRLAAQLEAAWEAASSLGTAVLGPALLARLLADRTWSVRHLVRAADLSRATALARQITADCQAFLGADHPVTLEAGASLGEAYLVAGQIAAAVTEFEHVLADRQRSFGEDDPATLTSRNDLGSALAQAKRLDEAVTVLELAAAARERVLGRDHTDTLMTWSNLAVTYWLANQLDAAIELGRNTVAARENVLGTHHPDTMVSRNNLGVAYMDSGQIDKAIDVHRQNLEDRTAVLTADHPHTLYSLSNLARAFTAAGRHAEAVALHEKALRARERVLGLDHPDTAKSRGYLAAARAAAGIAEHGD
jgi:tetratricopeptide (TPR) repeat protein